MFENVDGRRTDGRTTDARVTGILLAHLRAFGSGELKISALAARCYFQEICLKTDTVNILHT